MVELAVAVRLEIGVAHGVAVHRRIIERRQIDRRLDVEGQHAAARAVQRHLLGFGDRCDALADQPLHVVEPQQRTGKGETIVGQLRHLRAPHSGASPIGTACLSSRSAIASMSLRSITGTVAAGKGVSAAMATMLRVVRMDQRLAVGGAVDLQLRKGIALEALDQHEIDRRHLGDQVGQVPFRLLAQFMQDGEALGRGDDHFGGAGGAVQELNPCPAGRDRSRDGRA